MATKNAEIVREGADAVVVFLAFSEVNSPGPEDGAFPSCPPETACNYDGGANQLDWDPGDLAMTYVPGLAQVPGTNPATGAYGYFAADHLGSTRGVYNQSKAMTAALEYSPYGEPRAWRGNAPAPTYTGHYHDAESGLYFAPYRYYLPDAGRWLSRDPLGMVDGPNVYGYVSARVISHVDSVGWSMHICVRPVNGLPWFNHIYLYDDKSGDTCGRSPGSPPINNPDDNPKSDFCIEVDGTDGLEEQVMACCEATAQSGIYIPWINDCHDTVDDCLGDNNPGHPGRINFWRILLDLMNVIVF